MIDLYTSSTPNGKKISIALEEMELPYEVHPIQLSNLEQRTPEFHKLNPNEKIPVIKCARIVGEYRINLTRGQVEQRVDLRMTEHSK